MRKVVVVVLTVFFVAGFAASVWAADIPGQKLTPDELASVTGKASPVSIPMSFFQNLSPTGATVFINGEKVVSSSPIYTVGGITVVASATFKK
jgi:hypothetical protein